MGAVSRFSAAEWIAESLDQQSMTVAHWVPPVYESYLRILHPIEATDGSARTLRWAEVAEAAHRELEGDVSWKGLVQSYAIQHGSFDLAAEPRIGCLTEDEADAVFERLASHTTTPEACYSAFSSIYSWVSDLQSSGQPLFRIGPDREFLLVRSSIYEYGQSGYSAAGTHFRVLPDMSWPEGKEWFLATSFDMDSTLIGGSAELINSLVSGPYESIPVTASTVV
ncbi:hypothetical protein [Trujillonella endophytica]|uniref:hypothetical protein n=1 Tax=Trujillonella endophytica TaxID=673521 RepID=UPI0011135F2D|nr:hypothetical protein [Trujillella endophytica]